MWDRKFSLKGSVPNIIQGDFNKLKIIDVSLGVVFLQSVSKFGEEIKYIYEYVPGYRPKKLSGVTITNGGTGYAVGDILIVGDDTENPAWIEVTSVNSGSIVTVSIKRTGIFTIEPSGTLKSLRPGPTGATATLSYQEIDNDETCITSKLGNGSWVRVLRDNDSVSNIEALLVAKPEKNEVVVNVLGYHAPSDDGGGKFKWRSGFSPKRYLTASVVSGGSNWEIGDVSEIRLGAGTGIACCLRITDTVGGNKGPATSVEMVYGGFYEQTPGTSGMSVAGITKNSGSSSGLTVDTTLGEAHDFGTTFVSATTKTGRWVRDFAGNVSIKWFGAKGDESNDTPYFQYAIWRGLPIEIPSGRYGLYFGLRYYSGIPVVLLGATNVLQTSHNVTSFIFDKRSGDSEEPLLHHETGWPGLNTAHWNVGRQANYTWETNIGDMVVIKNINFYGKSTNYYAQGICLQDIRGAYIENVEISQFAYRGLELGESSFYNQLNRVLVRGGLAWQDTSDPYITDENTLQEAKLRVGLRVCGHTTINYCDATNYGTGLAVTGIGNTINGGRFEVNIIGITLGEDWWVSSSSTIRVGDCSAVSLHGISMERNYIGVLTKNVTNGSVCNVQVQGKPSNPPAQDWASAAGFYIGGSTSSDVTFLNIVCSDRFEWGPIINFSRASVHYSQTASSFGTKIGLLGGFQYGQVGSSADSEQTGFALRTMAWPSATKNAYKYYTHTPTMLHTGLTAYRLRPLRGSGIMQNSITFAKNLGGSVVPTSGATYTDVAFRPAYSTSSYGITLSAIVGANPLAAGTYWIARTIVFDDVEMGIPYANDNGANYKKITVDGTQFIRVTISTSPPTGAINRLYFGNRKQWFQNYAEGMSSGNWDYTSATSLSPISNIGLPPGSQGTSGFNIQSKEEEDNNYQIVATPSWPTTVWVSNKTTSGFRLNYGSPCPDNSQNVFWLLFRA